MAAESEISSGEVLERLARDMGKREPIEYKIMRWLIDHHHANVYQEVSKLPARELQAVRVVVACHECRGSGKVGGGTLPPVPRQRHFPGGHPEVTVLR